MPSGTARFVGAMFVAGLAMVSCSDGTAEPDDTASEESTPDARPSPEIVDVVADYDEASETWSFAVTVSSPYDAPERYADGWRVIGPDGTVFGVHTLSHHHAGEQPFTRTQRGVVIPDDVEDVTIEPRDLVDGFGGGTLTISLEP